MLKIKTIEEWIEKLKNSDKLIIVEGQKDKKALESLGIKNIITINKAFYKIIENIKQKEVIILTDLDREGKRLYSKLKHSLQKRGIKIDRNFREFLFHTKLTQIEGILHYLQ